MFKFEILNSLRISALLLLNDRKKGLVSYSGQTYKLGSLPSPPMSASSLKGYLLLLHISNSGTKSMQNTPAYEEPRSSGKRLHEYSFDHRSIH